MAGSKELAFMEVKANELTLEDVGQLLGYCLVAQPVEAILVAPSPPSLTLQKILRTHKGLLEYAENRSIEIGFWNNGNLELQKNAH